VCIVLPGFSEWYLDFVDKEYSPSGDELVMVYRVRPVPGMSVEEAAGRIASESSVGTWTTLSVLPPRVKSLMAKAFGFIDLGDGSWVVKVAYPPDLFEESNMANIVSSVLGNIFGMKAVESLRAEDIYFPPKLRDSFKGPVQGIGGVRSILRIKDRPILATVPKPKVGYDPDEYADIAYKIAVGGVDLIKDDENLASQSFCRFEERLEKVLKMLEKAERETGERKGYLVNITAPVREMEKRLKLVADHGNSFVMVDFVIIGWSALQYVRDLAEEYGLAIHAHRAFHAAFTRKQDHGVSMHVLAKLARLVGVDHLHIGTPGVGKLDAKTRDVLELAKLVRNQYYKAPKDDVSKLDQDWGRIKPLLPVSSGGLHPGTLPDVIRTMGVDLIIQVGGGVLGHPDGPEAGARAVRQAVDAAMKDIPLEDFARTHRELRRALEKWGYKIPI